MIDYLNELVAAEWHAWWAEPAPSLNWVLLTNGGSALHDNVIFLGVPLGQREPALVAKTCRWPAHNGTIRQEFEQLTAVWQHLDQRASGVIPRPLHLGQVGQDLVLVTDYFTGQEMTEALQRWAGQANEAELLGAAFQNVARWLGWFHRQTAVSRTADLCCPFSHYADIFREMFELNAREQAALTDLVAQKEAAQAKASQQILQHSDFWPGNIILRPTDERIALIDWQFSRWTTDASYDLYFLPLASGVALVRGADPVDRAQRIGQRMRQWQQTWLPDYFGNYGQPTGYTLLSPEAGFCACCVEAASRPMATFGVEQDDALLWRQIFAELI